MVGRQPDHGQPDGQDEYEKNAKGTRPGHGSLASRGGGQGAVNGNRCRLDRRSAAHPTIGADPVLRVPPRSRIPRSRAAADRDIAAGPIGTRIFRSPRSLSKTISDYVLLRRMTVFGTACPWCTARVHRLLALIALPGGSLHCSQMLVSSFPRARWRAT
jgi:hypothetical protein